MKVPGGSIVVLFNPYSGSSPVYMQDSEERSMYVEASEQRYVFHRQRMAVRTWRFNIENKDVANVMLEILNKLNAQSRSSPVKVVRHFTTAHRPARPHPTRPNALGMHGILEGGWHGQYDATSNPSQCTSSDGQPRCQKPTALFSTQQIISEYLRLNTLPGTGALRPIEDREPVRFGQCFAFSGLLGTALRLIGIPTRMVTGFLFGKKKIGETLLWDASRETAFDFTYNYDKLAHWKFHVWVETWMSRPDLRDNSPIIAVIGGGSIGSASNRGWQFAEGTSNLARKGPLALGPVSKFQVRHNIHERFPDDTSKYETYFVQVSYSCHYFCGGAERFMH